MAAATLQLDANLKPLDGTLILEPVCNGGWIVSHSNRVIGEMSTHVAAVSNSEELLRWMEETLHLRREMSVE